MLLKIPLVAQVPPVEHVRVDIAPQLGKLRNVAHLTIEIGRGRNGHIGADFPAAISGDGERRFDRLLDLDRRLDVGVDANQGLALGRVHELIHQPQAGHGILGVAHGFAIGRGDFIDGVFFR